MLIWGKYPPPPDNLGRLMSNSNKERVCFCNSSVCTPPRPIAVKNFDAKLNPDGSREICTFGFISSSLP